MNQNTPTMILSMEDQLKMNPASVRVSEFHTPEDARLIVRAVKSYTGLVAALEGLVSKLNRDDRGTWYFYSEELTQARAAIARAKGQA